MSYSNIRLMFMAIVIVGVALAAPGRSASEKMFQDESHLLGVWTGDSICQVKGSRCRDEKAIYRISKSKEAGKVTIDAGKMVNGKAESMGVLEFRYDRENKTLYCKDEDRVWEFRVNGNIMEGTLTVPDKVIYRRVSLKKEE